MVGTLEWKDRTTRENRPKVEVRNYKDLLNRTAMKVFPKCPAPAHGGKVTEFSGHTCSRHRECWSRLETAAFSVFEIVTCMSLRSGEESAFDRGAE